MNWKLFVTVPVVECMTTTSARLAPEFTTSGALRTVEVARQMQHPTGMAGNTAVIPDKAAGHEALVGRCAVCSGIS